MSLTHTDAAHQARVEVAAACRLTHVLGWTDFLATHISVRVPGRGDRYFVNPWGVAFDEVNASSVLEVDLEGRVITEEGKGWGELNAAGTVIHGAIHATGSPQAEAVVHLHSKYGVAVACQRDGLLPLTQSALMVYADLAYHDYQGVVLDEAERQSLLADLGDKHNLILRNHGTLSIGRNMAEAFGRIAQLDRACRFQITAQSAGVPLVALPQSVIDRTTAQARAFSNGSDAKSFPSSKQRGWAAYLRKLDRELPGYRD
jgi:ribulose-5-phosphate 4-epimerase/fuculose-1-phosphate aldolase